MGIIEIFPLNGWLCLVVILNICSVSETELTVRHIVVLNNVSFILALNKSFMMNATKTNTARGKLAKMLEVRYYELLKESPEIKGNLAVEFIREDRNDR